MVKKKDIKKVVEDLGNWEEGIQYPLDPDELQKHWADTLSGLLKKYQIEEPLNEKDFSRVRDSTISIFFQANLEAIKKKIDEDIEIEVKKFEVLIASVSMISNFFEVITSFCENSIKSIINSNFGLLKQTESEINTSAVISTFEGKIVESAKIIKPSFFMIIDAKITKNIREITQNILSNISESMHLTSKEQHSVITQIIQIEKESLRTYCEAEYPGFPKLLLNQYQEKLTKLITEKWMNSRDNELSELEQNFSVFVETILDKLSNNELVVFDKTICNQEFRTSIAQILIALFPEEAIFPNFMLDYILNLLDIENPSQYLERVRDHGDLEIFIEKFLSNSEQISRFFSIISLVLIFSGTYQYLTQISPTSSDRYFASDRQWLRNFVNVAFQRKYENLLEIRPRISEWTLVLMTEKSIARRIPDWRSESDIIDMIDYIEERYSAKAKNLGDKIQDYSDNTKNKYLKNMSKYASKFVKSITPSKNIKQFSLELIKSDPSLHVTITVSGWLSQEDDMEDSWIKLKDYKQQANTYALRWDSGSKKKIKSELFSTIFHAVRFIAAHPILKLVHLGMIMHSNPFKKRAKKAQLTGKVLADLIFSKKLGNCCISLIGFSLGTRVICYCLKRLKKLGGSVHDVILLGGAAPCNEELWRNNKTVVKGRLINAYSKTDKILSHLYTISRLEKAIGNYPINVEGIENYDVTEIATGHLQYREVLDMVLQKFEYNTI